MSRRSLTTVVVVLLVATAGLMAVAMARRAQTHRQATEPAAVQETVTNTVVPDAEPLKKVAPPKPRPKPEPTFSIARVRNGHRLALRSKPAGRVLTSVGATTQFGSPATLAVAAHRRHWVGVTSTDLPNGTLGWVKATDSAFTKAPATHISIRVDLSRRSLELRDGRKTIRRTTVGIGRPGSATPTGRFSITDKLSGTRYGPYYGCCILALSGHQVNTPAGWQGGDRLAIHGTNNPGSIGVPSSAGCLHADADDLRYLMRRVPLGTPVFIHS
jgi:lipoprotein-anchoring transpeptidase ErfK/SrfK